jgi:predicted glycosyltransferase
MAPTKRLEPAGMKKIWIDLDNSPHVPFFAPIIEELEKRGYTLVLTARDCFQVCALANLFHLKYRCIGRHYGKNKAMKILGTMYRALQLLPIAWHEKPDLVMSHGSRSQLLAATMTQIRSLLILDYEFAKPLPGLTPTWVMFPEMIPDSAVQFDGGNMLKYPGIKEDVYVPRFRPDRSILSQLGLTAEDVVVTVRPPATEAHYHNSESEQLFQAVMELLERAHGVKAVLLPRNAKQGETIRANWPGLFSTGKVMIPGQAVDGLNLIWHSDLVISGGGTMNREAAALGVPVYSIFRGKIGAVDRYLADAGRLILLESPENVKSHILLQRRQRLAAPETTNCPALDKIVNDVIAIIELNTAAAAVQTA